MKQIYAAIGKLVFFSLLPLTDIFSRRMKDRVRIAVVSDDEAMILLTKSWFSHQKWSLPGGGVGHGEALASAASRELSEETGITIPASKLTHIGRYSHPRSKVGYGFQCFKVHTSARTDTPVFRRLEILEAKWFSVSNLPDDRSLLIDQVLAK